MKKTRIIAITILLLSALSISVLASSGTIQRELSYRDIKITLNGKEITPKDANGNAVEPFIIDGTTYLPVRAVSEALGLDVAWDGGTNTVMLSEKAQAGGTAPTQSSSSGEPTVGQKNALKSAKNYLSFMPFSYSGLIEQLEYEQYSHEEAVYAADNCGADWFEQAAKSAKSYLNIMSFSKNGLIEQLEFEGYTHEQAVYGAEKNGY